MRQLIFAFFLLSLSTSIFSQGQFRGNGQNVNNGRFYGKIVDENTGKGVDAASVQLIATRMDSVTRKGKDTILAGMLTRKSGEFSLENLPVMGRFRLVASAIGYKTYEQPVSFRDDQKRGQD